MTPLVLVFLRGGADGLALVPPRDPRLRALRPTLHREDAAPLDDRFALHPALAPLRPFWDAGRLALVHAIGSGDATRSHFEAQDRMERGDGASGWLARWAPRSASPLARVALGPHLPEALRGARATVFERAEEAGLESAPFTAALRALHGGGDPLARAGAAALAALDRLAALPPAPPGFPATPLGQRLAEAARLVRADVGLEVACVDHDGWDTHVAQAPLLEGRAGELADALSAFLEAVGERATLIALTEFGRRARENGGLGTDHGRGSVAFVAGAGVRGGQVLARWPGLHADALEPPGDLAVTTDYRDLLAAALAARGVDPGPVFPGYGPRELGLFG